MNKRHMVRGKHIDTGELVTGYYMFIRKRTGTFGQTLDESDYDRHVIARADGSLAIVHPATIEPIAVPVKRKRTLVGDYVCPNCDAAFIEGLKTTPYCGNCGQRLSYDIEGEEI